MKKLLLLAVCALTLISCEIESDDPQWQTQLAEVTAIDVPEFFEVGKSYTLEVTYLLPTACHLAQGVNATREAATGSGRRKIYVAGAAAHELGAPDCNNQTEDLEETGSFRIHIDENMPYTFFLWTGVDQHGISEFTEVEVPVQERAGTAE